MSADVLVIGGGPAGAAAAITLAQRGRDVLLVERSAGPHHKVCGEFISHEALHYLRSLGLAPDKLGAVPIHAVRFAGTKQTVEAPLPFAAVSLTRRRLDEELLRCAAMAGARVLRGENVEALAQNGSTWTATISGQSNIAAQTVFLATGKHDLRGHARPPGKQPGMVAFKMYWQLAPQQAASLAGHVELLLYRGGYAGLQPVEDGAANLCCLVHARELQRLGGRWETLLDAMQEQCPHLRARLGGARPLLERPLAISSIPYGYLRERAAGLWRLGDQAAVIPSFTGDGMSLALHSAKTAAEMYLAGSTPQEFQSRIAAQCKHQVRRATAVSRALLSVPRLSMLAARCWPGIMQTVAAQTRIKPEDVLA